MHELAQKHSTHKQPTLSVLGITELWHEAQRNGYVKTRTNHMYQGNTNYGIPEQNYTHTKCIYIIITANLIKLASLNWSTLHTLRENRGTLKTIEKTDAIIGWHHLKEKLSHLVGCKWVHYGSGQSRHTVCRTFDSQFHTSRPLESELESALYSLEPSQTLKNRQAVEINKSIYIIHTQNTPTRRTLLHTESHNT